MSSMITSCCVGCSDGDVIFGVNIPILSASNRICELLHSQKTGMVCREDGVLLTTVVNHVVMCFYLEKCQSTLFAFTCM